MSTLSDVLAEHSALSGAAVAHLQAVVSEWQLLADLSFSDLLLWVPTEPERLICAAQARPTTGVTAFVDDRVSARLALGLPVAAARLGGGAGRVRGTAAGRAPAAGSAGRPSRCGTWAR